MHKETNNQNCLTAASPIRKVWSSHGGKGNSTHTSVASYRVMLHSTHARHDSVSDYTHIHHNNTSSSECNP